MSLIDVKQVTRYFQQGDITVKALKGIDLQVEKGEFTAIVGPSGSGKTTLMNLIGALDRPTGGEIVLNSYNLGKLGKNALAQLRLTQLGFIFQAYNLIPVLKAIENVEYVLMLQGIGKRQRRQRVLSLFQEMEMDDLEDRYPNELSGGQQQRVAVARALIAKPQVVIADEPTANLDSHNTDRLLDIMRQMCNTTQTTFLFSTHDQRVMRRADRILTLKDGLLESDETGRPA